MSSILLPIQPGTLPPNYCPPNWQQALNDFAENMNAILAAGMAFYNYGNTVPDPAYNAYPWLRTTDMRWYRFSGKWKSPNPEQSPYARRLFAGSTTDLQTYDGGDTGAQSTESGPMWEVDTDFAGYSPMGPGAIPNSNPAKTLAQGEAYGEGAHTMTQQELAAHRHETTLSGGGNDGSALVWTAVTPNSVELTYPSTTVGESEPMPVIHPVRGIYVIKRTIREVYIAT